MLGGGDNHDDVCLRAKKRLQRLDNIRIMISEDKTVKGEVLVGGGGKTGGAGGPGGRPYHGREGQGVMANW